MKAIMRFLAKMAGLSPTNFVFTMGAVFLTDWLLATAARAMHSPFWLYAPVALVSSGLVGWALVESYGEDPE